MTNSTKTTTDNLQDVAARDLQVGDVIVMATSDRVVTAVRLTRNRKTAVIDMADALNGADPASLTFSGDVVFSVIRAEEV